MAGDRGFIGGVFSQQGNGLRGLPGLRAIEPLFILDSDERALDVLRVQHAGGWLGRDLGQSVTQQKQGRDPREQHMETGDGETVETRAHAQA